MRTQMTPYRITHHLRKIDLVLHLESGEGILDCVYTIVKTKTHIRNMKNPLLHHNHRGKVRATQQKHHLDAFWRRGFAASRLSIVRAQMLRRSIYIYT